MAVKQQMPRGVSKVRLDDEVQRQLFTNDQTGRQSRNGDWSRDCARKRHRVKTLVDEKSGGG